MKNAIILHGCPDKDEYYNPELPSGSNAHWLPWLQKELLIRDITAVTPEMPHAYEPQYKVWCREVERFDIGPKTLLVGHSAGGGFWLRYLSEHPDLKVGKVVLVAPWTDPDKTLAENFYEFTPDRSLIERTKGIVVLRSDDDSDNVQRSITWIQENFANLHMREFSGYGHFTYTNLGGTEFPELLEMVLENEY